MLIEYPGEDNGTLLYIRIRVCHVVRVIRYRYNVLILHVQHIVFVYTTRNNCACRMKCCAFILYFGILLDRSIYMYDPGLECSHLH